MNCRECRELLVSHLEGVLFQTEAALVAEHLAACAECREELKAVTALHEQLLQRGRAAKAEGFAASVMAKIASENHFKKGKVKNMFQKHPLGFSAAAAAVIAVVVGLFIALSTRAYALSDTLEANRHITSIHFLNDHRGALKVDASGKLTYEPVTSCSEGWAEYGENGELLRVRLEFPVTEDGAKVTVWQDGKATMWFKDKKGMLVLVEPRIEHVVGELRQLFDPKLVMERLKDAETKSKVRIITQEQPDGVLLPIILIAEWSDPANLREVYLVDRTTNLVLQIETFVAKDTDMVFTNRRRFLDYNQLIPATVFALNPSEEVVMRVDQTTQEIGLPKGDLSDTEIEQKVARQFFESLIAKDYVKAGQLMEGIPGQKVAEMVEKAHVRFVNIVTIGEPVPPADAKLRGVKVPCEIEIEDGGVKATRTFNLGIRPVHGHPERWDIYSYGGF